MRRAPVLKVPFVALAVMAATMVTPLFSGTASAAPAPVRLVGADMVGTSVAVSSAGWATSSRVVIVNAPSWTDALAASSLSAPILYTASDSLPGNVANEVRRLRATEAVVIGGTA